MKSSILFKATLLAAISGLSFSTIGHSTEGEARYPLEMINRPSTMPTGIVGINVNAGMNTQKPAGAEKALRTVTMDVGTEFGIVDHVEGQFSYDGFAFDSQHAKDTFKWQQKVKLGAKYNYLGIPHVSASAAIKVPLYIMTNNEILREFTVGLPTVFYNEVMAGSLFGNLFTLTMRPHIATKFDFNWWYGYQVYGNFWAMLEGTFGSVELKNPNGQGTWEGEPFWKKLPLNLSMTYAFNHYFDLGANVGFDDTLKAGDTFKFGLTFTARAGRLFGQI